MLRFTFSIYKLFYAFIALLFFTSCVATKNSNKQQNSSLSIGITRDPMVFAFENSELQDHMTTSVSRGLFLTQGIPLVLEGVKELIRRDQEKYNSEISQNIETNYFYNKLSTVDAVDPRGMQINNFIITRTFFDKKTDLLDTAYVINLEVDKRNMNDIINNSVFTLKINDIDFPYFQAKIPDDRWYLPWTYIFRKKTNVMNVDLELNVKGTWKDRSGNVHINEPLGKFLLLLRDVPVDDEERKIYFHNMKDMPIEGYSFLVPRSSGYYNTDNGVLPAFGYGNFNIDVKIKESSKHKFVTRKLQENSDVILKELNQLID